MLKFINRKAGISRANSWYSSFNF